MVGDILFSLKTLLLVCVVLHQTSYSSGSSCSKLTMSLANDSLKFTSSDTQICWNFCWKNVSSFCTAKATHIFSAKNIRILYIESAKTVNEMTHKKLVKLTMLCTTGPWYLFGMAYAKFHIKSQIPYLENPLLYMDSFSYLELWLKYKSIFAVKNYGLVTLVHIRCFLFFNDRDFFYFFFGFLLKWKLEF